MSDRPAQHYVEGTHLPPETPGGPAQLITSIEADPVRDDHLMFTTSAGKVWSFKMNELTLFPRRDVYGTTVDWTSHRVPPYPRELAIGDRILPARARPKNHEHVDAWRREAQVVSRITVVSGLTWQVEVWDPVTGLHLRYRCHREERLTMPRDYDPTRVSKLVGDGMVRVFGPYEHLLTGHVFLFATHPWGRGLWPATIPKYDVILSDPDHPTGTVYVVRPPRESAEYAAFTYRPDLADDIYELPEDLIFDRARHPRDGVTRRNRRRY